MANNKTFAQLLEEYLADKLTPEEHKHLMQLIKTGDYDEQLKVRLNNSLFQSEGSFDMESGRSKEMIERIITTENYTEKLIPSVHPIRKYALWFAGAAAAIVLLISGWLFFLLSGTSSTQFASKENKPEEKVAETKDKKYIRLADGSTVLLNKGSQLTDIRMPDTGKREVWLTGEAYFDIKHDEKRPFIVHTGDVQTMVLGTAFDIRAYANQNEVRVTVTRGKVRVSNKKKVIGIITPNESITVNTQRDTYKEEKVVAEQFLQWKQQYLILDDISLEEAAILIGNKYHVKFSFLNDGMKQCHISATFLDNE